MGKKGGTRKTDNEDGKKRGKRKIENEDGKKRGGHEKPTTKTPFLSGSTTKRQNRRAHTSTYFKYAPPPRLHRRSGGNTGGHEQAQSQYRACRLTANKPPPDTRKYQKRETGFRLSRKQRREERTGGRRPGGRGGATTVGKSCVGKGSLQLFCLEILRGYFPPRPRA